MRRTKKLECCSRFDVNKYVGLNIKKKLRVYLFFHNFLTVSLIDEE